jgi:hypothetical protein
VHILVDALGRRGPFDIETSIAMGAHRVRIPVTAGTSARIVSTTVRATSRGTMRKDLRAGCTRVQISPVFSKATKYMCEDGCGTAAPRRAEPPFCEPSV